MKIRTAKEIRLHNARLLQATLKGGQDEMCERLGKSQSQVSAFMGRNPSKGIGDKVAREIERAFARETGWLDIWHEDPSSTSAESIAAPQTELPEELSVMDDLPRYTDQGILKLARQQPFDIQSLESCIADVENAMEEPDEIPISPRQKASIIVGLYVSRSTNHGQAQPGDVATAIAAVVAGSDR